MVVGFDAKRAFLNTSGLGNYSRGVISSLTEFYPQHEYLLFTPKETSMFRISTGKNPGVVTPRGTSRFFPQWWRMSGVIPQIKLKKVQVYHGLSNELPVGISMSGIKSVVTIHDLIYMRYPQFYRAFDRKIYREKGQRACREADRVIAISHQTKDDVAGFFKVPGEKISVIHQAVSPLFFSPVSDERLREIELKLPLPRKFILCVGTIEERKNLLSLVKAFAYCTRETDADLVVIGRNTNYRKKVDEFISDKKLKSRIHFHHGVSNDDLPAIYKRAQLLAYPSQFEGFGLPVVEALASETPVVTNDLPVFREAGGPATAYVNANEPEEMGKAILDILTNNTLRQKMTEEGIRHAKNFIPQKQAEALMALYEEIIS